MVINKHFFKLTLLLLTIMFHSVSNALSNIHQLKILNHFDDDLVFVITINPDILPDWKETFTLAPNQQTKSTVLDMGKEAYIHVEDHSNNSAFWGIEILNNQLTFHGYISKNIAYSWSDHTIIFCTPAIYKQKGSC